MLENFNQTVPTAPSFQVLGIDHHQAPLPIRSAFSLSAAAQASLYQMAAAESIPGLLILSTCNRTELYSIGTNEATLRRLWAANTAASAEQIAKRTWTKSGKEAIRHMLRVGSGLESKILGDLQIIHQLKRAATIAQEYELYPPFLAKWVDQSIRGSKRVKNETALSDGSASASYASLQAMRQWMQNQRIAAPKIVLIGTGEIGRSCAYNILKHLPQAELSLSNRSPEKAITFAQALGLKVIPWTDWKTHLPVADMIVFATAAPQVLLSVEDLADCSQPQLILDLAVPCNTEAAIGELIGKKRIDMDQIGAIRADTFAERASAIPMAEEIVAALLTEFQQWLDRQQLSPLIQWVKQELKALQQTELNRFQRKNPSTDLQSAEVVSAHMVHSLTAKFAQFIHHHHQDLGELQSLPTKLRSS